MHKHCRSGKQGSQKGGSQEGDLRQRLQKSNMVIASLSDKSTQTEMQETSLKAELEVLKRSKEEEAAAHKKELQENKDQAISQALQLAAKDSKIQELHRNEKSPPKKANNRVAYDDEEGDGDADSTFSLLKPKLPAPCSGDVSVHDTSPPRSYKDALVGSEPPKK
jgi:hypothetical protein